MQEYEHEYAEFLYYTPGYLDREAQLWPVRAGRNAAKPHYKVGPKRIECYSLHFVLEGGVCFEFEGKRVELQPGDLFCLFPGRTYFYHALPAEQPLQMHWLAIDGSRVKPLLKLAGLVPERPFGKEIVTRQARELLGDIIEKLGNVERWSPAVSLELQGGICRLLAELIPETAPAELTEPSGWIRECIAFMDLHATEGITVQQVAAFAGVHRSYFSNVFTSQIGVPPQKFLQKIRMEKAKRLVIETDASVTEIALSLGYPNLYTFTRAFKMYYKMPPLAMRNRKI
ncbi:AraC family transcriptional regulator [Paenibacillus yonginensis]|uniref:AraC family transcriptional regulator n=1 Tax=Paenibacillus yonginensis TaxID=1462996 RepID=A0A1B1MXJ5_9BACL|nr:AraC family transcriptional regulator [Paenibacillus yonginensis]ANS73867.1 AraC family transcriptional regulator [Paenibacillus yonginensis]